MNTILTISESPSGDLALEADTLIARTAGWVVIAGLIYRALLLPVALLLSYGLFSSKVLFLLILAVIFLMASNCMAVWYVYRFESSRLKNPLLFCTDVAVAVALNVIATASLEPDTFLDSGSDPFWQYMLGTIVVWTALLGPRVGAYVLGVGLVLESALIAENSVSIASAGAVQVAGRVGWLVVALVVPWAIVRSATKGAREAVKIGQAAGVQAAREKILLDLHDIILQVFAQMLSITSNSSISSSSKLEKIEAMASLQALTLRQRIRGTGDSFASLSAAFEGLRAEFEEIGFAVIIHKHIPSCRLSPEVSNAVVSAVREALNNSWRYSFAGAANLKAQISAGSQVLVVEVVDNGCGFDPQTAPLGYGIVNSIGRRLSDAGGDSEVVSSPRNGTRVIIRVPIDISGAKKGLRANGTNLSSLCRRSMGARNEVADDQPAVRDPTTRSIVSRSRPHSYRVAEIEELSQGWLAVPALVYRCFLATLSIALGVATVQVDLPVGLIVVVVAVQLIDLWLLSIAVSGRFRSIFRSTLFMIVDIGVAIGLNLWSLVVTAPGEVFEPGHQFLWGYMYGVIVLWTALRGWRVGLSIVLISIPLEIAMGTLNDVSFGGGALAQMSAQLIKLVASFGIALVVAHLSRRGIALALAEAELVAATAAKATALREVDDVAVNVLGDIEGICRSDDADVERKLSRVRGAALVEVERLRRFLVRTGKDNERDPNPTFDPVLTYYRGLGLRVELVTEGGITEVPLEVFERVRPPLGDALDNVHRHAGVDHVVLSLRAHAHSLELIVRDHGHGFVISDPPSESRRRYDSVTVTTWSGIDEGTRVRIVADW